MTTTREGIIVEAADARNADSALLRLEDASTSYGATEVLRNVSLDICEGEVVCLLGANGAGKTTTIRLLSGQLPLLTGHISWQGKDISDVRASAMIGLGIATVPEGRRIFPDLTVKENLYVGAFHRRRNFGKKEELDFAFEMFPRLKERERQLGGTLSGGEQQMLAIARALMARPRLLLLDEPSMGLSPLLIDSVLDTIERLAAQGTTILLVEQNAEAALAVARRAYIMERGEIVLSGTAKELSSDERVRQTYLGVG